MPRTEWIVSIAAILMPLALAELVFVCGPSQTEFAKHFGVQQCSLIFGLSIIGMLLLPLLFSLAALRAFFSFRAPLKFS
jgi:hypothetical protein